MSKKCTPLWREAHFEVKMLKTPGVRTTFEGSDVASRGRRKGLHLVKSEHNVRVLKHFQLQPPLHSITLHYNYKQLHLHYILLHYTPLHYTALNYAQVLHCTQLRSSTLHYTTLHYTTLHYTTLHYTTLHNTTTTTTQLHSTTLNYTPRH